MSLLLLVCFITIYRVFYLKEKLVILIMITLLTLGAASAIVVARLVLEIMETCSELKLLIYTLNHRMPWLTHLYKGNAWALCIFIASFNLAHWIFAMQYWSLAFKLQLMVKQKQIPHLGVFLKIAFYLGAIF